MGGLFLLIDPGSVGGMKVLLRENKHTGTPSPSPSSGSSTSESSDHGIEIAPHVGGIVFIGENENATFFLGKRHHGRSCLMHVRKAAEYDDKILEKDIVDEQASDSSPSHASEP